jgi:SAM-dependent methyltransferase
MYVRAAFRRNPPPDGARVLDAGCGEEAGLAAVLSRRFPQVRFYAADLFLRSNLSLPPNLKLMVHDVQKPLPEGAYHIIYSADLLEHVEAPDAVLGHFFEALVPGGRVFLHTPAAGHINFFKTATDGDRPSFRDVRPGDLHQREGFSEAELTGMLSRAGFAGIHARKTFSPAVSFLKELYTLGERRGIPAIGLMIFPFILLSGTIERIFPPLRGNGILVEAVKPL